MSAALSPAVRASIEKVRQAFAALDLTPENERIVELQRDLAHIDATIESTNAEMQRVVDEIRNGSRGKLEAASAADALIAGRSMDEATGLIASTAELEARRDKLKAAIWELRTRAYDTRNELEGTKIAARRRAGEACRPLVDTVAQEMHEAGEWIVAGYALLKSLAGLDVGAQEKREAEEAAAGVMEGFPSLRRGEIELPGEITEMLQGLADKSPAILTGAARKVDAPTSYHAALPAQRPR